MKNILKNDCHETNDKSEAKFDDILDDDDECFIDCYNLYILS